MKTSLKIFSLAILLLVLFLSPSCVDQEKYQEAWDSGYETGYYEGYNKGAQAVKVQPKPSIVFEETVSQKVYVGSVNSDIYHYPHCEWARKISPYNEVWFSSIADAKSKGYRPCKVCRPPG